MVVVAAVIFLCCLDPPIREAGVGGHSWSLGCGRDRDLLFGDLFLAVLVISSTVRYC